MRVATALFSRPTPPLPDVEQDSDETPSAFKGWAEPPRDVAKWWQDQKVGLRYRLEVLVTSVYGDPRVVPPAVVPPAGFEPALPPPEGGALSPELRGLTKPGQGISADLLTSRRARG